MQKKVKLTKLRDSDEPMHPNHIPAGKVVTGLFYEEPKVGESFDVGYWSTSTVQEIIDANHFRTHNSIYHWTIIDE